ncbi:MAG TPA: M43 family zinc metalloprotease [Chitinophagaceae bacterium]|nr:M43 family zinc metalloprotease [Chitinophagaceae bacterium]
MIIFVTGLMMTSHVDAQRTCGTPLAIKQALAKNPKLLEKYNRLKRLALPHPMSNMYLRGAAIATIPVVVHIVLPNPNTVTDAQVQSQINVLNTDYNAKNPDSVKIPGVWKSLFGDMRIRFCLAERTPEGNPTNGIDRVKTNVTTFSIQDAVSAVKHAATGGADAWDPSGYLNIWVCHLGQNTLGVGTPPGLYQPDEEGAVIEYDAFGTVGDLNPEFNKGRTCTHELGHYFNLLHPWGDGDGSCSPGDEVNDTPPQSAPVYGSPVFPYLKDHCSPDPPGVMITDFMGYVDDSCMEMFTNGQVARAQAALFDLRASLLTSDGCKPVILKNLDAKLQTIISPHDKLCMNDIAPVVTLKNMGKQTLTKVNIDYSVDRGTLQTYAWSGSLGSLDSLQVALPASGIQTGKHKLTAYTSAPNGQPDEQKTNDTLSSTFHLDPLATAPFSEGFEEDPFPPPGWEIRNPDDSITWEKTQAAAHGGSYSVVMRNLDYEANGPTDDLITPVFDIQKADSAFLYFYVAAGVQSDPNGSNQYWDTLQVLISHDCAQTGTSLYKKWGKNLITDTVATPGEFIPKSTQWRRDSINLTPYLGNGNFQIIFRNITNFENNIYLDDINLVTRQTNPILKKEKVLVVPNPTTGWLSVQFLGTPPGLQAVSVYNSIGQLIYRKDASRINTQNRIEFNLAGEPNGVYFVKVSYTDHQTVKKIVKIK